MLFPTVYLPFCLLVSFYHYSFEIGIDSPTIPALREDANRQENQENCTSTIFFRTYPAPFPSSFSNPKSTRTRQKAEGCVSSIIRRPLTYQDIAGNFMAPREEGKKEPRINLRPVKFLPFNRKLVTRDVRTTRESLSLPIGIASHRLIRHSSHTIGEQAFCTISAVHCLTEPGSCRLSHACAPYVSYDSFGA
jgi:hypothetical protein